MLFSYCGFDGLVLRFVYLFGWFNVCFCLIVFCYLCWFVACVFAVFVWVECCLVVWMLVLFVDVFSCLF